MTTPLQIAAAQLQEEIDVYQHGTKNGPPEGSSEFYLLRALVLGLSYLKRLEQLGVTNDPAAAHRVFRERERSFKLVAVPPPEPVPVESLAPSQLQ